MSEVLQDKMFKFAYNMAFRDATLRLAFQKLEGEKYSEFLERKDKIKNGAYEIVKNYIHEIFEGKNPDPEKTIVLLCDKFETDGFTFGNAQKLVNMAAKYMYLSTYDDTSKKCLFVNCHCPMDGIMIKIVSEKSKEPMHDNTYKNVSWSRIKRSDKGSVETYYDFQTSVRELCNDDGNNCLPLEYDYLYYE